jgi:hypothetical protein
VTCQPALYDVQRVWSQNEIKPHLTRIFKLSTDPDFEAKFWDVIGLYLNPPEQAAAGDTILPTNLGNSF